MFNLFGSKRILRLTFSVVVEPDEGGFHAYAPAFKGLHVDGGTEDEALQNALKAVEVYLDSISHYGDPLPIGPHFGVREEIIPAVPEGALFHNIEVQWPSLHMSGVR